MSDSEYEDGYGSRFIQSMIVGGIFVVIFMLISIFLLYPALFPSQEQIQANKQFTKNWEDIKQQITKMDCTQLQKLRLDKIAGKDISPYGEHWGDVRDTYNTLSCGTMWNWWED